MIQNIYIWKIIGLLTQFQVQRLPNTELFCEAPLYSLSFRNLRLLQVHRSTTDSLKNFMTYDTTLFVPCHKLNVFNSSSPKDMLGYLVYFTMFLS